MHPVLFTLPLGRREIALHSYGILIAAGLGAGIWVAYREGRRRGLDGGRVLDLAFWLVVSGLVGSRLTYGLVNARSFFHACADGGGPWWRDCTSLLAIWEGGLVFYGGVAAAAAVAWRFSRRQGWSFGVVGDLFAPALAIGHAFGRLGCFAAGCCFGKETAARLGVAFPRGSVAFDVLRSAGAVPPGAAETPPLHPTQLYEAAGELALFGLLLRAPPAAAPATGRVAARLPRPLRAASLRGRDLPRRRAARASRSSSPRPASPAGSACRPASRSSFRPDRSAASLTAVAVVVALARRPRAPRTPAP